MYSANPFEQINKRFNAIENLLLKIVNTPSGVPPANQVLTVDEAASFLKLAKQTVYQLVSARDIPFSKKGKRLYFQRRELEQWIAEGRKRTRKEISESV